MRSFSRFMVWMLVMASMGSTVHAQVVLNMPPPRSSQPQTVVDTSPASVDKAHVNAQARAQTQAPVQPSDPARVGNVALARYAQARARPRPGYGYGGRYGGPYGYYGYYDPYYYGYGYYPLHFGFGHFSFGHHFHHHHDMGMGGGGGD